MNPKFGIQNFRVFCDYTEFELAPITVLTGTNGCGKSSLVKALRLLKFNIDNRSQDFLGQLDELEFQDKSNLLGDFAKVVNWDNTSGAVVFSININVESSLENPVIYLHYKKPDSTGYDNARLVKVEIVERRADTSCITEHPLISYEYSDKWSRKINVEGVYSFLLNYTNPEDDQEDSQTKDFLFSYPKLELLKIITRVDKTGTIIFTNIPNLVLSDEEKEDAQKLIELLNEHQITNWNQLITEIQQFEKTFLGNYNLVIVPVEYDNPYDDQEDLILNPKNFSLYIKSISNPFYFGAFQSELAELPITNSLFYFLLDQDKYKPEETMEDILFSLNPEINPSISEAFGKLHNFSLNAVKFGFMSFQKLTDFYFLEAERIKMRRYFFEHDDDDFSQILFDIFRSDQGLNPAMTAFKKTRSGFIEDWLKFFEIADGFEIIPDPDGMALKPFLKIKENLIPLIDLGFGINQILPIILKIAVTKKNGSIFIEEPESNLHPALQSKLADMLMDAHKKFGIRFVLETHSEYLIRKLQYLVAKKEINPSDISIYYLYHPDKIPEGAKQVERIEIDENGILSQEFGTGFFDEALNWKFELLRLKSQQKN